MNDARELRTGQEALTRYFESRRESLADWQVEQLETAGIGRSRDPFDVYLLSASADGDLLTLWRNYGGGEVAYSIGLDDSIQLVPVETSGLATHPEPVPPGYRNGASYENREDDPDYEFVMSSQWQTVKYIEDERDSFVHDELEKLVSNLRNPSETDRRLLLPPYLYFVGPPSDSWKHRGFEDERERRATWEVGPSWKFVRYRAGRFGLVPYIEVSAGQSPYVPLLFEDDTRLPIRAITIGPTPVAGDAERGLRALLDANGYGEVQIRRSVTPFR